MELRNSWYSCDTITTQLGELFTLRCVYVDKAIHVADAEALDAVLWVELPLCTQTVFVLAYFLP